MDLGLAFITCDVQLFIAAAGFRLLRCGIYQRGKGKKKSGGGELREKKNVVHSLEGQDDIDVEAGTSHGIAERQGRGGASQVRL